MADGKIVFEVTADGKHAIADIKDITKQIDKETKKWDSAAEDAADGTASAWDKAVGSIVGKLTAAGVVAIFAKWHRPAGLWRNVLPVCTVIGMEYFSRQWGICQRQLTPRHTEKLTNDIWKCFMN